MVSTFYGTCNWPDAPQAWCEGERLITELFCFRQREDRCVLSDAQDRGWVRDFRSSATRVCCNWWAWSASTNEANIKIQDLQHRSTNQGNCTPTSDTLLFHLFWENILLNSNFNRLNKHTPVGAPSSANAYVGPEGVPLANV